MSCRVKFSHVISMATLIGSASTSSASLYGKLAPPAGPYPSSATAVGSTAIIDTSSAFAEWASSVPSLVRGPEDIANPGLGFASVGTAASAIGPANGSSVVSLGDGGSITLAFDKAITNGPGADFAVFENGFSDNFLELGFVDVSSDGTHYARFPAVSLTQTITQIGSFGPLDASKLYDLAGNYKANYGTPFDLSELAGIPNIDINNIQYVRVTDVVGRITPVLDGNGVTIWSPGTDYYGNIINDPYNTPFASSGFDLDGVGVMNTVVPEPASLCVLFSAILLGRRSRKKAG